MNKEEKIVFEYLIAEGFTSIKHEPDGNIPPDFSIEDKIAIEVRRLNENYFSENKLIGYREEDYSLWDILNGFCNKYKNQNLKSAYRLSFFYERPIPEKKELKKLLKQKLDNFFLNPVDDDEIEITPTFSIKLTGNKKSEKYNISAAISLDENGGGAILQIYLSNINFCIEEKTTKIEEFRKKYSEWWIILVDRMIYRVALDDDLQRIKKDIILPSVWNKLIIINPDEMKPVMVITSLE